MYSEFWARISAILVFLGFNITFFTQFILGAKGMPRRYYNYLDQYQPLHAYSTYGSWILALGFIIMAVYLIHSLVKGRRAPDNPWQSLGLEWTNSSPPPPENFTVTPKLTHGPYDYDKIVSGDSTG
jgi:cytochrome c oxidase subunit 1